MPNVLAPASRIIRALLRPMLLTFSAAMAIGLCSLGSGRAIDARTVPADLADADANLLLPTIISPVHRRIVMMEVTAYCPCRKCCGPKAAGITASGKHVSYNAGRFAAADTRLLPFGTRLLVPGYHDHPVEVIDRGGAIKGNKLDVFFASHQRALEWGRRTVPVIVIE